MKRHLLLSLTLLLYVCGPLSAQNIQRTPNVPHRLFIDVHHLPAGKVSVRDVASAHAKDLAVEGKHGVHFLQYWVDEQKGDIYCLSEATDTAHIVQTHREAHGLLPHEMYEVSSGEAAVARNSSPYFLDVHTLGAGNVKAADVEKAHQKDLALQAKYGVNFINYWVDEKKGLVLCLSQASDASNVMQTHQEAHGLIPSFVVKVKTGQ